MKKSIFVKAFNEIEKVVPFTAAMPNGTGYMNGIVTADLGLAPGEKAKTTAWGEDKRRIIIIGTRHGNVAIFERYTPTDDSDSDNIVVVSNAPDYFSSLCLVRDGSISDDHFNEVVGVWGSNVGERIESIMGYETSPAALRRKKALAQG